MQNSVFMKGGEKMRAVRAVNPTEDGRALNRCLFVGFENAVLKFEICYRTSNLIPCGERGHIHQNDGEMTN